MKKIFQTSLVIVCLFALSAAAGDEGKTWDISVPVTANHAEAAPAFDGMLQVVAFNIERGFFWRDVADYLRERIAAQPATVILLSECDRNHSRTGDVFVADELARALKLNLIFATEYIEYNDTTPITQGDHGNAVLSPFPLEDVTLIRHVTVFDWSKHGAAMGEPRFGGRVTVGATVVLPGGKKVRVYTTHLESHAGSSGKWKQMKQIVEDIEHWPYPAVIGGDLNELPGMLMFRKLPRYNIENAFHGDRSGTGSCKAKDGRAKCSVKIDWILYKDLGLVESEVDYPLNHEGGVMSDHAPVRALFEVK